MGFFCGVMAAKYVEASRFAKNLRQAMFENIHLFHLPSLDKFSTAGLVTLDHRCDDMQMAYQMISAHLLSRACQRWSAPWDGFSVKR